MPIHLTRLYPFDALHLLLYQIMYSFDDNFHYALNVVKSSPNRGKWWFCIFDVNNPEDIVNALRVVLSSECYVRQLDDTTVKISCRMNTVHE